MAMKDRCPACGALVLPEERYCARCGAKLQFGAGQDEADAAPVEAAYEPEPEAAEEAVWRGGVPRTIGELKGFCEANGMPLERMRFFIGEDCREPRAFGIYRDGEDVVVYKNKSDGSRAVRYHGPDEAHGVKELYDKLLDECHKRDIWPDGKPEDYEERKRRARSRRALLIATVVVAMLAFGVGGYLFMRIAHRHDGYYRFDDYGIYYCYGGDWYYDDDSCDWVEVSEVPEEDYTDYYVGDSYEPEWGGSDFYESNTWEQIQAESHTDSSDYNSWDSGDTDWDSDW